MLRSYLSHDLFLINFSNIFGDSFHSLSNAVKIAPQNLCHFPLILKRKGPISSLLLSKIVATPNFLVGSQFQKEGTKFEFKFDMQDTQKVRIQVTCHQRLPQQQIFYRVSHFPDFLMFFPFLHLFMQKFYSFCSHQCCKSLKKSRMLIIFMLFVSELYQDASMQAIKKCKKIEGENNIRTTWRTTILQ